VRRAPRGLARGGQQVLQQPQRLHWASAPVQGLP
jgi:hypothetical protein